MHLVVAFLLIGSGLTAVIADAPRWWSVCLGSFDTEECVARQDHAYDIVAPDAGWAALDAATALMGISSMLLALAALWLFRVLVPHRWSWLPGVLFAIPQGLLAMTILGWTAAGEWVGTLSASSAWWITSMLWPVALAVAGTAWLTRPVTSGNSRWPAVGAGALAIASPMAIYLTMSIFYMSHDTVPWTMTVAGLLTVLAGVTFLLARDKTRGSEEPQSPPRSAATGSSEAALSAG